MNYDYDLLVIGAGSGGLSASKRAAHYGAKVAIAEQDLVGGTCVIRGCVPKKLLVYASHFHDLYQDAVGYGWDAVISHCDWSKLITAKDREIERLNHLHMHWLKEAGVALFSERAVLCDAHTAQIGEHLVTAEKILLAVGGEAVRPDIVGMEHTLTSREMFDLPHLPKRLAVLGAGYIAVEFACIMQGLGSQVTLIVRGDHILRGFDEDLRAMLRDNMIARGINIRFISQLEAIVPKTDGFHLTLDNMEMNVESVIVDQVLCAIGRVPLLAGLGLEKAGVKIVNNAIKVDDYSRTSQPHIFAVGDCTDRVNLTPVAVAEGRAFADTEFGHSPTRISHELIATAVFSQPELATVGLTEAQAHTRYPGDILCYRSRFRPLYHTLTGRPDKVLIKLLVQRSTDRILGAHMCGEHAAEIIQALAISIKMGATKKDFDATMALHPTLAEEFVTMRTPVSG